MTRSSAPPVESDVLVDEPGPGSGIDWNQVKEWDERYYIHPFRSLDEYQHAPVERAEGSYLYLADGTRLLDFMSQYICTNLGQGHPKVKAAIAQAIERYTYLSEPWTSDYRSKAAKLIIEDLLGEEGWAGSLRFVSTGSEAVEMAIIMAKLFTGRPNIVTQEFSYHGWTQGAAGSTGLRSSRGNISAADGEVLDVPGYPPGGYHLAPAPSAGRDPDTGMLACVSETESLIRSIGPETVAAFICDVSLGAGSIHPPDDYIPQIRDMTRRLGVLWIDDEVLCGFGRMGKWFGYQSYPGVYPDIMAIGKGLVASAIPAAAVVVRKDIGDFFKARRWWLPSTMGGHPVAMAAVVATIEAMLEEGIVERAAEMGLRLEGRLREMEEQHACVGGVAGEGMFWLIELVKDKRTGERFVPDDRYNMGAGDIAEWPAQQVTRHCIARGVFITGFVPNTLRLGPPLTITDEELDEGLAALDSALSELDKACS